MQYCASKEVKMLSQLVADFEDEEIIPYIQKASVFVESRLSSRYRTPLPEPVPPILASICADLAASYILDQHTTERVKDQTTYGEVLYRRATNTLERLVENGGLDFVLPLSSGRGADGYRPAIRSTTYPSSGPSEMQKALNRW